MISVEIKRYQIHCLQYTLGSNIEIYICTYLKIRICIEIATMKRENKVSGSFKEISDVERGIKVHIAINHILCQLQPVMHKGRFSSKA